MKLTEVMRRARFIKQGSRMIFVCDLSNLDTEDAIRVVKYAEDIIKRMPKKTVHAVAHLTNVKYNEKLESNIKHVIKHTDPHVLKGAVAGITDQRLKADMHDLMSSLGRNKETFVHYEDAIYWLASDAA